MRSGLSPGASAGRAPAEDQAGVDPASPPPIRVLWLIKGLAAGGAERLLVNAAASHDRTAFHIEVAYLLPDADQLVPELEALGVQCTCLGLGSEADLRWVHRLRRRLRDEPVDVLHMHSPYAAGFARIAARTLPRAQRPRLVTTEHNAWSTYRPPTRLANALTAALDDAVLAVSGEARESLPWRRRRRAVAMAHGVRVDDVRGELAHREAVRAELGVGEDTFLVGTVANYHRKKDWPTLLEAARIMSANGADVRFCGVGHGPLEQETQELHRTLGLEPVVSLMGYRPDAIRLMAGTDVFVLATKWEGLPVALMEACALGLPIVATAVGGIPEHFTDNVDALLVEPGRADALAKALLQIKDDPSLRSRLSCASSAHRHDFDARRTSSRIEAIYREVLDR